jgi:5-methylcytosine-specific restriction endonuclease McrA
MSDSEKYQQESRGGVTAFEPSRLASFDRDTLLAEIKRVLQKFRAGRAPTHKDFNRISRVHSATIVAHFGTWEAAMRAAGVDYARSPIATSDLEGDLRRVLDAAGGKYFTQKFYRQSGGRYNWTTLKKRLGCSNWTVLLEKVLQVHPDPRVKVNRVRVRRSVTLDERSRCTPELLLTELRSTAAKSSREAFSYEDYRALGGRYSKMTFQNHIGGWRYAVSLIGRVDGHSDRRPHLTFTNEEYFSEMQRVWELLGRQPKCAEMKQYGSKMSHQAFQVRFGSWMRAMHAFCEDRGSAEDRSTELAVPSVGSGELAGVGQSPSSVAHEQTEEHVTEGLLVIRKATPRAPSLRLRFKVLQRDRFTCRACGRSPAIESGVVLHIDHIIPYSGPGETTLDNLQTLCERCNLGKSDSLPTPE